MRTVLEGELVRHHREVSMSVASLIEVPYRVAIALTMASNQTGADYDYLTQTAARESNFQIEAKSPYSSASGLFQFIDSTWLSTLKTYGPQYGLGDVAERIFTTRNGRHYVPNRKERKKILAMRHDPYVAALMAGAYTNRNRDYLVSRLDRNPTPGELYMAHFLGAADAVKLIELSQTRPNRRAWRDFPQAARANRSIFYDRGRGRTVREVYIVLQNKVVADVQTRVSSKGTARSTKQRKTRPTSSPARSYMVRASTAPSRYVRRSPTAAKSRPKRISLKPLSKERGLPTLLRGSLGIQGTAPDRTVKARKDVVGSLDPWVTKTEVLPGNALPVRIRKSAKRKY